MRKVICLVVLSAFVSCSSLAGAEQLDFAKTVAGPVSSPPVGPHTALPLQDRLVSPSVARRLHDMAYEIGKPQKADDAEIEQAIVLLKAAMELDSGASYVLPTLIEIASRASKVDHSKLLWGLLTKYLGQKADLEVADKAITYLLERANSREEREKAFSELLMIAGQRNNVLSSELLTMLGLLMAEKPDNDAAKFYLTQAYKANKLNKVAFWKYVEMFPENVRANDYLVHFRLALSEDPSSIEAAMGMGRYAEKAGLYDTAAAAYQYCADLFRYLYPSDPLPASIYIPWAISCYNTDDNLPRCMEILNTVRQEGQFNIQLEALAGKAAAKLGDDARAAEIFQTAQTHAEQLLRQGPNLKSPAQQQVTAKQFAWFYCFALPSPVKALDWANKAYAIEPNSPSSASILAYALIMNGETEWAKPQIEKIEPSQISELVQAQIQIAEDKKDAAKETLIAAIARDPGSLAAEKAKVVLGELGGVYIPSSDPDVTRSALQQVFGKTLVPVFAPLERMISIQFNLRGNEFAYGSEFGATVAVVNNSSEPFVVSDNGLFRGNIRVDASISGDLATNIPGLVSMKVHSDYFIEPGQSILIPVKLVTGRLRRLLLTYPQASLDILFTLYIDPVVGPSGDVRSNRLAMIKPTTLLVRRPRIELGGNYLRNRFNLISQGQQGQKIQTARLFIGLLMEQYAMSGRKPPYEFMYADWMANMFRNALVHESGLLRNPDAGEWVVKVHTMAEMQYLPLDYDLVQAVADNLENSSWPVRMMTMYLLAKTQQSEFGKVVESAATYDPHERVREMAIALGAVGIEKPTSDALPAAKEPAEPASPDEK
jgi:tetratricopeptide (TPR) repeat protein